MAKNVRYSLSIPNELVERADKVGEKMGMTRTTLFNVALSEYLFQKEMLLDKLNQVCDQIIADELGKGE